MSCVRLACERCSLNMFIVSGKLVVAGSAENTWSCSGIWPDNGNCRVDDIPWFSWISFCRWLFRLPLAVDMSSIAGSMDERLSGNSRSESARSCFPVLASSWSSVSWCDVIVFGNQDLAWNVYLMRGVLTCGRDKDGLGKHDQMPQLLHKMGWAARLLFFLGWWHCLPNTALRANQTKGMMWGTFCIHCVQNCWVLARALSATEEARETDTLSQRSNSVNIV